MGLFSRKKEEIGEKISHLEPLTPIEVLLEKEEKPLIFFSKLVEVKSEKDVIITVPRTKSTRMIKLSPEYLYKIRFITNNGLLENTMQIISYEMENQTVVLKVKLLDITKKIQRRQSFRLNIDIDFCFSVVDEPTQKYNKKDVFKAKTQDISSGGMKFLANEELEQNSKIKISLKMENIGILSYGIILHKEKVETEEDYKYSYKVKFESMPQIYRESLSKFIFDKQRELSKKGKIGK